MKMFYRALILVVFCASIVTPVMAEEKNESHLQSDVKSAILIERDTGEIIFEKEADKQLPPASMTKIMTLVLVMEELEKGSLTLEEEVTTSARAASMGGSQIFLSEGEKMSVHDLLKGIAIASGNDASVAIAERIAGSEEAFVAQMNQKAKDLGLKDTHFVNASGLPAENHYSSAHDMAMMAKELLKYKQITAYTSIYEDYLRKGQENEFWLVNTNKLIRFYPYVDGLKTGFTREAQYCLTATAKKDDMRVIAVVMGAETVKQRNAEIMQMIDYAFTHYETELVFEKGETVAEIRNLQAEKMTYDVQTSEDISVLYKKGTHADEAITTNIHVNQPTALPVKQGSTVGRVIVKHQEKVTNESNLIVEEEIVPASLFTLFKRTLTNVMKYKEI